MSPLDRRSFLLFSGAGLAGLASSADARVHLKRGAVASAASASDGDDDAIASAGQTLSVLGYGADPTGQKDSTSALQKAVDEAAGGRLLVPRGKYKCSAPIVISRPLWLDGETVRGERALGSVLFKDAKFGGDALLRIAPDGDRALSGVAVRGVAVNGHGRGGSGIKVERAGNVVLSSLVVLNNPEWGIVVDGGFFSSLHNIACVRNGTPGAATRGGGLLFSSDSRESADCRLFDSYFNKNAGAQMKLTGQGGKSRVVGLTVYGTQFELPDHEDARVPVVAIEACDRSTFFGCNIVQMKGKDAPCVTLGDTGGQLNDVCFNSCYFQYNGAQAALKAGAGANGVSFIDFKYRGNGAIFDFANGVQKGAIHFSRPIDFTRGRGAAAISYPVMANGA